MKKKPRREREYSTETLVDVTYDPEDVADYDSGNAPMTRNTQPAEKLDDLAEFQKRSKNRKESQHTHNYSILDAEKETMLELKRRGYEIEFDINVLYYDFPTLCIAIVIALSIINTENYKPLGMSMQMG